MSVCPSVTRWYLPKTDERQITVDSRASDETWWIKTVKARRWHVTISCQPDGRPPQHAVRPWKSGRVHLAEGSNVVVLEQEIRSVELGVCPMQLFHFLITS